MPFRVFGRVLAFTERQRVHWLENLGAKSLRTFEVCVNVRHVHDDVLADLATPRRAELASLASDDDGSLANEKLGMGHNAIPFGAQALGESKSPSTPRGV